MRLIKEEKLYKILAEENKQIRDKNDIYEPEHIDKETGELIPEHIPYYSTIIYVPTTFTEELMNELYVEEDIEEKEE